MSSFQYDNKEEMVEATRDINTWKKESGGTGSKSYYDNKY